MKKIILQDKKKTKVKDIIAAVLITALAMAVGIGAFALVCLDNVADASDSREFAPAAANITRTHLFAASEDSGVSTQADATEISKICFIILGDDPGPILTGVGSAMFTGTENIVTYPVGGSVYNWVMTCDVSEYVAQGYTNFRLHDSSLCAFEWEGTTLRVRSGVMNTKPFSVFSNENPNIRVNCDLPRVEVPLPDDPMKEGHHFVGWYYDEQLTQPYDGSPVYEDTALYAKFAINTYTVTYDTAGGKSIDSVTVDWNTVAPTPTPSRVGYYFMEWQLPNGTTYTGQPIKENTTLIAVWQIKTYTVTFYVGEEKYKEFTVEFGTVLVDAMESADIVSYKAMNSEGLRVSKRSVITEDTQVLITKLTGWEKYGDFVGRNPWYTWVTIGVLVVLLILAIVGIAELAQKRHQ